METKQQEPPENRLEAAPEPPEAEPTYRVFPTHHTTAIGNLALALSKAQGACTNGPKDKEGYGYKYMTLPTLIDIARKPLADNELSIIQTHELVKGKSASVVTHTTILHSSGEWFTSSLELIMKPMPQLTPTQVIGIACTYGRRYALQSVLLIAAEEDSDGAAPK